MKRGLNRLIDEGVGLRVINIMKNVEVRRIKASVSMRFLRAIG
jgi:hypothetical protein